jgi:long-chain acyl-CoA synthetase
MQYVTSAQPPQGEICIRGPNVFHGYFKDAVATSEAFDDDGWLRSGDIGQWLPNGALRIIDRRKNIFKLSQGEYIAPEKVENVYTGGLVSQIFVHGDSLQSHLVAVVVPDMERAR